MLFCNSSHVYTSDLCEQPVSHRKLPGGIMDLDCERLCNVYYNTTHGLPGEFLSSYEATKLCYGLSGVDYCRHGK